MKAFIPVFLLIFAACAGSPDQLNLALKNAAVLKQVFEHTCTENEQLFARSNPPAETLQAYMATQMALRSTFDQAYEAHVRHLGSWAGIDAQHTLELAAGIIKELK